MTREVRLRSPVLNNTIEVCKCLGLIFISQATISTTTHKHISKYGNLSVIYCLSHRREI